MYMMTEFSWLLLKLRREKDVTVRSAAASMGFTPAALSSYERGKKTPSMEFLIKIADYYNVSIDDLCGRSVSADGKWSSAKNWPLPELPKEDAHG